MQMLPRRYTIEIGLLHRMVKLSLPIAGETGDADHLDGSRCGAEVRGSESVAPLTPFGHPGCQGRGAGASSRPSIPARLERDRRWCGWGPVPLRARPAPRCGSRAGRYQQRALYSVYQKIPFDDVGSSVRRGISLPFLQVCKDLQGIHARLLRRKVL